MASDNDAPNFDASLGCLYASELEALAAQLCHVELDASEREATLRATREAICASLHAKLSRLLILELNAARVTGQLRGEDSHARWDHFIQISSTPEFWDEVSPKYPDLRRRVGAIVANRCAAAHTFARNFAKDRTALDRQQPAAMGLLRAVSFGAGDTHQGGKTVAILDCGRGRVVYKPRSMAIDAALLSFVDWLKPHLRVASTIQVPQVIDRGSHGWAQYIEHRYASDEGELRDFYRGVGHWLGVMRLLGGNDLHAENLIAHGGSPVVVDCETMFVPNPVGRPTGLGDAFDRAASLISGSVLGVGLLPGRGLGLGWRGVDNSALGMLPGEQPTIELPAIVDAGTDVARIGLKRVEAPVASNHPSPQPMLARYWDQVLEGFEEVTHVLRKADGESALEPQLARFRDCIVRLVPRPTESYAELARMLWHPVSLHKQAEAIGRAAELLEKMADNIALASDSKNVIRSEIEDLLVGDIPFFTARVCEGAYASEGGESWLKPGDLRLLALQDWRRADLAMERNVIQASLVSAYINDGWTPGGTALVPSSVRTDDLDARRRRIAARIMREAVESAIPGADGTVAWIAPILEPHGWSVQPIGQDLYAGVPGVALLAAAYLREVHAGRADEVAGVDAILQRCLRTMQLAEWHRQRIAAGELAVRPPAPGAFIGISSLIWVWLTLERWGMDANLGLHHARLVASTLDEAVDADTINDLLVGTAGTVVPLLHLALRTGEERWLALASRYGDRVCERAQRINGMAFWPSAQWPGGVGGFAHGSTGVGWTLEKLSAVSGSPLHRDTARAAFAFERSLLVGHEGGWRDLRTEDQVIVAAAWCHGAVGIGVAHLDLDPALQRVETREILEIAIPVALRHGLGWNHTLCHGDLGVWELIDTAVRKGLTPEGASGQALLARIVSSLEEHSPICGFAREAFVPGLFSGLGGVAYQLLRAHPEHALPSLMTLSNTEG
jgi:type 2 lantibiotic biosynthesis protein LanM